jgi:hypothetical protein
VTTIDDDASTAVERYEALRSHALGGQAAGWRLGLAVLERQGVAAWLRAWESTAPTRLVRPTVNVPLEGNELVGALATMALACISSG